MPRRAVSLSLGPLDLRLLVRAGMCRPVWRLLLRISASVLPMTLGGDSDYNIRYYRRTALSPRGEYDMYAVAVS